jgi:hypothetical protein
MECSNYRGISLLNPSYKICAEKLCSRVSQIVENILKKKRLALAKAILV